MPAVWLEHPMRKQQTKENRREANVGNEHWRNPGKLLSSSNLLFALACNQPLLWDWTPETVNFRRHCFLWAVNKPQSHTARKNLVGVGQKLWGTERDMLAELKPINLSVSLLITQSSVRASLPVQRPLKVHRKTRGKPVLTFREKLNGCREQQFASHCVFIFRLWQIWSYTRKTIVNATQRSYRG